MKVIGSNSIDLNHAMMIEMAQEWMLKYTALVGRVTAVTYTSENHCQTFTIHISEPMPNETKP